MKVIHRADIAGARIVGVHETYEISAEGCDCRQVYFTVDRGFTFITPMAGERWTTVELPQNAKQIPDEIITEGFDVKRGWFGGYRFSRCPPEKSDAVKQIKLRQISGVYCGLFDEELGFHYPHDGTIVFSDGSQASNTVVAPHGTGGAGLYFFTFESGRCTPVEKMVDYFTIPIDDSRG